MLILSGPEDFLLFVPEIYFPISWTAIKDMVNGKKEGRRVRSMGGRKIGKVEGRQSRWKQRRKKIYR